MKSENFREKAVAILMNVKTVTQVEFLVTIFFSQLLLFDIDTHLRIELDDNISYVFYTQKVPLNGKQSYDTLLPFLYVYECSQILKTMATKVLKCFFPIFFR